MRKFRFEEDGDIAGDILDKYGYAGDLAKIYA